MSTTVTFTVQVDNEGAADSLRNNLDIARLEHEGITIRTAGGSFHAHVRNVYPQSRPPIREKRDASRGDLTEEEWKADAAEILTHQHRCPVCSGPLAADGTCPDFQRDAAEGVDHESGLALPNVAQEIPPSF